MFNRSNLMTLLHAAIALYLVGYLIYGDSDASSIIKIFVGICLVIILTLKELTIRTLISNIESYKVLTKIMEEASWEIYRTVDEAMLIRYANLMPQVHSLYGAESEQFKAVQSLYTELNTSVGDDYDDKLIRLRKINELQNKIEVLRSEGKFNVQ